MAHSRFLYFVAFLFLAGCAAIPVDDAPAEMPAGFPDHSFDAITSFLERDDDDVHAFRGSGRITMESPGQSGRFSAQIQQRRGDSLHISLSPGLGIEAARALVTPDSFFVYERIGSRLTYGAIQDAEAFLPRPLMQDDLMSNMLGLISPDPQVDWQVTSDSLHYQLMSPDGLETYIVDPTRWRVVRYEMRAEDGSLQEERSFSDFGSFNGKTLPRRVLLRVPENESTVAITYRDIELNPGELDFDIRAGSASERVLISSSQY